MQPASAAIAYSKLSDPELAQCIASGDKNAFELLMRRHNQMLYRTARSILRDDAEAEDAVQEAYLLAYRGMRGFRGDAKLSTWLVRIVVNEAIARRRKRSRGQGESRLRKRGAVLEVPHRPDADRRQYQIARRQRSRQRTGTERSGELRIAKRHETVPHCAARRPVAARSLFP